jgi:hypothetical protein
VKCDRRFGENGAMGLRGFFPLQPLNCVLHKLTGVAQRHLFFDVFAV